MHNPSKVIILGSGALKIGEAGEFDYSGSQAIKALKEERISSVLVNPNIATIQTSDLFADQVYFLPINEYFVEKVIQKEKPDAIFLSFGGQTALNCGVKLHRSGVLKKHNVQILGTPVESIILSEDRELFAQHLRSIGLPTPDSTAAETKEAARAIAADMGFPVMVRAAYALGGQKSGVAFSQEQFEERIASAFAFSPQILIEKYLHHYKEVEYEVVRDAADNCVTVCNMENMDPLGIHTGESVVVAPSQTLTNDEYHRLREVSIQLVRSLGIVGECNVQYAVNPKPNGEMEYYIIELNARLSRSSALASKATGYPLAYVAAKLALGYNLQDIPNQINKVTQSFFEPALDYVVTKVPRWDLEKFRGVEERIGSSMKSVGEVMGIGRTFEESFQKAIRMLDIGAEGITENHFPEDTTVFIEQFLTRATPKRMFALAEGFRRGISLEQLYEYTGIDPWFLHRVQAIVHMEQRIVKQDLFSSSLEEDDTKKDLLLQAKQIGISDRRIAQLTDRSPEEVRTHRKKQGIVPYVFQIDTLAGEFPAETNYLYFTYNGAHHDVNPLGSEGVMVLGSGPYRIGSSVEFDWTCVNTALSLKSYGKKSIIINCNPETVSTDYDISNRLYFDELTTERVLDVYDFEQAHGVIVSVGGQTSNNLSQPLAREGVPLLGTSAFNIDRAEDRSKFSNLLDELNIPQPRWNKLTTLEEAIAFASEVDYPVLIRPSYVLSGAAMNVCYNEHDLKTFIQKATQISNDAPVAISKFIEDAKEVEFDAVAKNGDVLVYAISEHIEHAGVHSGDATIVYPTQRIFSSTEHVIRTIAGTLAKKLEVTGPFNIQFLAKENDVYVIEMNLRASRTFPLISKAMGVNFAHMIGEAFMKKEENKQNELFAKSSRKTQESSECSSPTPRDYVVVKAPQFSFSRLEGADPVLHVEMASTGEVACFGDTFNEAYYKAILATGIHIKTKKALLSLGGLANKERFRDSVFLLQKMGYTLFATDKTHDYLESCHISTTHVSKLHEHKDTKSVLDLIQNGEVSLVINLSERVAEEEVTKLHRQMTAGYRIRRATVDANVPLFTDFRSAKAFVQALASYRLEDLQIKSLKEYVGV